MIDLDKAKKEFMNYVSNYDATNKNIDRKIYHSLRVMEISKNLATSINLSKEDIDLATLIGLLHDIARFEQAKQFNTFKDKLSFDHGDYGVKILEENDFIRDFIQDDKYDDIIKTAIKNHNKFKIEENLDERTLLFAKMIRDADKIDILYEATEMFWNTESEVEEINNSLISDDYYGQFKNKKPILRRVNQSPVDNVLSLLAFIYDLNFDYSKEYILNAEYIDKILNRFNFTKEETKNKMDELVKAVKEFLLV
jgi:putative nucleotidyltransferase with HDIG domain